MLTEKDYCDLDTSHELWVMGLEPEAYYDGPIILLYEAQKWLREVKKIEIVVLGEKEIGGPYYADIYTESGYAGYVHKPCEKYEEALSEGIKAAVKILKEDETIHE